MGKLFTFLILVAIGLTVAYLVVNKLIFPAFNKLQKDALKSNLDVDSEEREMARQVKLHNHLEDKQDEILNKLTKEN